MFVLYMRTISVVAIHCVLLLRAILVQFSLFYGVCLCGTSLCVVFRIDG